MKKRFFLILGMLMCVAAIVATYYFVIESTHPGFIYVANHQIDSGQKFDGSAESTNLYFKKVEIFSKVNFDAIKDLESVKGKYAVTNIPEGAVLTSNMFASTPTNTIVTEGNISLSISVQPYMSITEGDNVNLIGVVTINGERFSRKLAENVKCTAVFNKASKNLKDIKSSESGQYEDLNPYKVVLEVPMHLEKVVPLFDQLMVYTSNPDNSEPLDDSYYSLRITPAINIDNSVGE